MLNRIALRTATVEALRGATLAGDHVLDSQIGPIDEIATDQPTPFIVVYTDDGHYHVGDRNLFSTQGDGRVETGWLSLVIEIGVSQRQYIESSDSIEVVQPQTDRAIEFAVDLIERQVLAALADPRPAAAWAETWRLFAFALGDRESRRGTSARDGARFGGRQIVLQVRLPMDPPPGQPINPLWQRFLGQCAADPSLLPLVQPLTAVLQGAALTEFEKTMAVFTLNREELKAMNLGPVDIAQSLP